MKFETNILSEQLSIIKNAIKKANNKNGSILLMSGETSYGKSFLAKNALELCNLNENNINGFIAECESPIGQFNISNVTALKPFTKIVENLIHNKGVSAQKKFALNVGLTLLTSIPLAGEVFYAAKEISKDWREYKKDKSSEENESQIQSFYNTICSYADKNPLLIIIEDLQWCDNKTINLLELFSKNIDNLPIVFLLSFRRSDVSQSSSNLYRLLAEYQETLTEIVLLPLNKSDLSKFIKNHLANYIQNDKFEEYLYSHTFGIPGTLLEYLNYFKKHTPFDKDGNLTIDLDSNLIPISTNSILSKSLENIKSSEKNILSTCASEGRQFSIFIVSKLLNLDYLTTIKKLKKIQNKTGLIKSIGTQNRYGVKTTIYEFTQSFYFKHFESLLEFEEYENLHSLIASILKDKYESTTSKEVKDEIAPYLVAHSQEAGDKENSNKILIDIAKNANLDGNNELFEITKNQYLENIGDSEADLEDEFNKKTGFESNNSNQAKNNSQAIDLMAESLKNEFLSVRQIFVNEYHNKNFKNLIQNADEYYETNKAKLKVIEKVQLLTLIAKSYIEMNSLDEAEEKLKSAAQLIEGVKDFKSECFLLNTIANYYDAKGDTTNALNTLKKAAQMSIKLPEELKLLTLTNIALILEKSDKEKAKVYFKASEKLTKSLSFSSFNEFLNRN